ncbi:hypothetical protein MNBD_GAMMA25-567 [hydrothermal vent metagenome]|uniref:Uncharacterized protein n=1 Tax=hydrothermal vent metagenome TaxID=652676 RepID=A0A3B1B650_9ZZZZ
MKRSTLMVGTVAAYLCTFLISVNAHAAGTATRSPINAVGDTDVVSVTNGSLIDLNPGRASVSTNSGYDSVTSIRVDTSAGVIRGYAEYDLNQNRTYSTIDEAGGSTASGILSLDTFLVGPTSDPTAPSTVDVTIEMEFDGSFSANNGAPSLVLIGDLNATTISSFLPLEGNIYQSLLTFTSTELNSPADPVTTTFAGVESALGGTGSSDYAGASADILGSSMSDLNAILRLTFPLALGDSFILSGVVVGIAGPAPDPADTDLSDGISILAAAGIVDFSNTARMRIFLPEGYSLGGGDPLLDNIVNPTTVPVPAALWLMISGLVSLLSVKAVGRKRSL